MVISTVEFIIMRIKTKTNYHFSYSILTFGLALALLFPPLTVQLPRLSLA